MADPTAQGPTYHALLIGIDAYPSPNELFACVNDIDAVERLLMSDDGIGLPCEQIKLQRLTAPHPKHRSATRNDPPPTKANIVNALKSLAETATAGDRVLVYYSGHGAQGRLSGMSGWHECLVPVDIDKRLWDVEFNSLIMAIAKATDDVTIILDACNSAGATRAIIVDALATKTDVRTRRFIANGQADFALDPAIPVDDSQRSRGLGTVATGSGDAGYLLLAAAQDDESAIEQGFGGDRHGTLTYCLLEQLGARAATERATLRWWDIWPQLLTNIVGFSADQHPRFFGNRVRRVFGGESPNEDPGYSVVAQPAGRFAIGAGSLMGIVKDAELAVYGVDTRRYSPLNSQADLDARRGHLRIIDAAMGSAVAVTVDGSNLTLPLGARARLIKAGSGEQMKVAIQPSDASLAGELAAAPLVAVVDPADTVTPYDVLLLRSNNEWQIGNRVEPVVARVPVGNERTAAAIRAGLEAYHPYHVMQALGKRFQGSALDGKLRVTLLDCRALVGPAYTSQQLGDVDKPNLDECPHDDAAVYTLKHGDRVAVRVDNRSPVTLEVALFDCTASGTVEFVDQMEIKGSATKIFWYPLQPLRPFAITLPPWRQEGTDQLVVVGTTKKDMEWSSLKQDQRSIQEVVDDTLNPSRDLTKGMLDLDEGKSVEQWTSTTVPIRIGR
ncbi:MAG: caspase domain-containing protein [Anaerolineae bacterium]